MAPVEWRRVRALFFVTQHLTHLPADFDLHYSRHRASLEGNIVRVVKHASGPPKYSRHAHLKAHVTCIALGEKGDGLCEE